MWDGVGGAIKRGLRRDLVDKFTLLDNLEEIQLPHQCYEHQRRKCASETWRKEHESYKIDVFECLWVEKFDRPRIEDEYSSVEGIRSHRSFMVLGDSKLKMRLHDCWCRKCRAFGTTDADDDDLLPCPQAMSWPWKDREVRREDARGVRADRIKLEEKGRALAAKLKVGDFVAVQHVKPRGRRGEHTDCYWVGVVVNQGNGKCTYVSPCNREINGVGFDKGEIAVAVRWLEREGSDTEHRTFRMGPDNKAAYGKGENCLYFNAALLRAIPNLTSITPRVEGRDTRSTKQREQQARWRVSATAHAAIEKTCYY